LPFNKCNIFINCLSVKEVKNLIDNDEKFEQYPNQEEIDQWVQSLWDLAETTECIVDILNTNGVAHNFGSNNNEYEFAYVKFIPKGMDEFFGYWQPAMSGPAPLLIHVPGYSAEMSMHPYLAVQGYNVLHISPLGYTSPDGPMESKKINGEWPVLPETNTASAEGGYKHWLVNCILAIKWAMNREKVIENRISFFGTSQGGGASLLLGSIFQNKGVRCVAADLAFLTNYPMALNNTKALEGAYSLVLCGLSMSHDKAVGFKALGYFDTILHARRLTCQVLLTAGEKDTICPPETIESLFKLLPGTRSYSYFDNLSHRYSREFIQMISAWFRMYS